MRLTRKGRWAVPAVAVVITGGVIAGSAISVAQAAPALPSRTPAQLLADVSATHQVPALTGTVVETTALGLPALPETGNQSSLSSMLTGSHTLKVYYQDRQHFRLAMPQTMSETDVIRDGSTEWLWESSGNTATKFQVPASSEKKAEAQQGLGKQLPATPQQAADQALAMAGKTTAVSVQSTLTVAGEAAYQLVLAPKDARSLIGSVRIAIDGETGVPLRVQVFAKGAASPAFQVGYTQISYVAPDPANFAFTPPAGATVENGLGDNSAESKTGSSASGLSGFGSYGSGWLSVTEVPQSVLSMAGKGSASDSSSGSSSGSSAFGGYSQMTVSAFLGAGKSVSGSWGSGKLIHTSLVNVLLVGNEIYVGAVEPSVLYAAVGHATPAGNASAWSSATGTAG